MFRSILYLFIIGLSISSCAETKIISKNNDISYILNTNSELAFVIDKKNNILCRETNFFQNFNPEKISEINILGDEPFIIYENKKIILDGDIFEECEGIKINSYKNLPKNCQFVINYTDCARYVCSNFGCKWMFAEFIIDLETGEYYPEKF